MHTSLLQNKLENFSKQTFLFVADRKLRTGKDIDWIPFWKEFKPKGKCGRV